MTIDIEQLIKEIDEDGSGKIEYGEFSTLLNGSWTHVNIQMHLILILNILSQTLTHI